MSARVKRASGLEELRNLLALEQGPLSEGLRPAPALPFELESFGDLVAAGTRTRSAPQEYALLTEAILEGYLLHYGESRVFELPDPDLRLLAGDYLYAFGLARLARLDDLLAVDELADLISLCAQAHSGAGQGRGEEPPWRLARALWALATLAVADGTWAAQTRAKQLARTDGVAASSELLAVAVAGAESSGLEVRLERALIAFQQAVEGGLSTT